jgi:hypothetical protein
MDARLRAKEHARVLGALAVCAVSAGAFGCGSSADKSGPIIGVWASCEAEGEFPEEACAELASDARLVFDPGVFTLVNLGSGECGQADWEWSEDVLVLRECEGRTWSEYHIVAAADDTYLTFTYGEDDHAYSRRVEMSTTEARAQCDIIEDVRCLQGLPNFAGEVYEGALGTWRRCGPSSEETSSELACASPSGTTYLVVNEDGSAQYGCDLVDLVATESVYAFRYCGGFFTDLEGTFGQIVFTTGAGGEEWLRIEDAFGGDGYEHFVKVDPEEEGPSCASPADRRC